MLPEMGLNTFVSYGSHLTEAIVKAGIDGLITNGYRDAGYVTYVIDDGWTYPCPSNVDAFFSLELGHAGRAVDGTILVDTNRFPGATGTDTLKYLVDYIHARGLKAGIYMEAGPACTPGSMTGSGGHEQQDINTVASWGVDSIKFDQLGVDEDYYARLNQYCLDSGRKMYLQSGAGGVGRPFGTWIPDYLNAWRPVPYFPDDPTGPENGDMHPPWTNFMAHVDSFIRDAQFIGPGHVPDGDDAATAGGDPQCVRAIMTMWAMYSVTMHITGSQATSYEKEWLTNSEVIAIDQDAAVLPARICR